MTICGINMQSQLEHPSLHEGCFLLLSLYFHLSLSRDNKLHDVYRIHFMDKTEFSFSSAHVEIAVRSFQ